jgi:integrase
MIDAHTRHLRARGASPRTITDRTKVLRRLHTALPYGLAYASTDELEDWLASDDDWSQWTRYTYANHVRGFYAWANGTWLAGDPAAVMARPRQPESVPRPVSDDELATALGRAPEPWRTAIVLAAFGGLRIGEAAGLRREDVDADRIWIRRAKGGSPASVDTHPLVWETVEPRPPGPLCVRQDGRPADVGWFYTRERLFFDRIGLGAVTMHRFRHWYGTTLLSNGADLRTVQEALRHRNVASTQGYTAVGGGQRRLAIRSLPNPTQHPAGH